MERREQIRYNMPVNKQPPKEEKKMPILQVSDLKKIYTTRFGGQQVQALTSVIFAVEP